MADRAPAVAIVGMAATFPGAADLQQYRDNVFGGVDAITSVPETRWDALYYDPEAGGVDRFYCRRGGFVDTLAVLDPAALGVVPTAVDSSEPDQLLVLALAVAALADAGLEDPLEGRDRTGVIVGRGGYLTPGLARLDQRVRTSEQVVSVVRSLLPELNEDELAAVKAAFVERLGPDRPDSAIGLVPNLAASLVANRLDFGASAYTVDAACASSLVAVDHAVVELMSGRCDRVLAGGVHLCHDVTLWSAFTQLGALSRSEVIRPFDRTADGLLIGEGGGMVVLERLADAEQRGAHIYAVVRGVGVSSDGRQASLMRPSVAGQVVALERAWTVAGLDPATVGLLEAHGTATPTGDAAELESLARFFGPGDGGASRAVLGSVKSMIGHSMPAAGVAGLIKAALAVEAGVLPPTLHCDEPHPMLAETRFVPLSSADEWPSSDTPRRAAVNAFGFGGINGHVVLEQHRHRRSPQRRWRGDATSPDTAFEPNLLLARETPDAMAAALQGTVASPVGQPPMVDGHGPVRLALFNPTPERLELARKIVARGRPWHGRNDCWFTPSGLLGSGVERTGKLAFVFPGVEPSFEPRVGDLARALGTSLPRLAQRSAAADDLEGLGRSIIAVGRLLHRAVISVGLHADVVAGQSIGEWSGMVATEMVPPSEVEQFIATLRPGTLDVPGIAFAALGCAVESAERLMEGLARLAVSHDNCPRQTIVCGPDTEIDELLRRARNAKVLGQVLPFRSGFHTPMFEPFLAPFRQGLARLPLQPPRIPLWSATTCAPYPTEPDEVRALALSHLVERVRFRELTVALHDAGVRVFVQVGVGSLPGLIDETLKGREFMAIGANSPRRSGMAQLLRTAAACWVEGMDGVHFERFDGSGVGWAGPHGPPARPSVLRRLPLETPLVRLSADASRLVGRYREVAQPSGDPLGLATAAVSGPGARAVGDELVALLAEIQRSGSVVAQEFVRAAPVVASRVANGPDPGPPSDGPADPDPRAPATRRQTGRRTLSVEAVSAFADHCLYRQPPGWPSMADRFPVVPMTGMIEMMVDAALDLVPGSVAVGIDDVRALRWLAVAPPVEVVLRAEEIAGPPDSQHVRVSVDGYARATVVLADRYPPAPEPSLDALRDAQPVPVTVDELYSDRWLFHGPRYQGVRRLGPMDDGGIDGELAVGDAPGALLDNAGQLMGLWIMLHQAEDRLGLPTQIDRVRLFGPRPPVDDRVEVAVRVSAVDGTTVRADLELLHRGRLWARIEGWVDRRFETDEVVWPLLVWPERSVLAEPRPGGWVLVRERWRSSASRELMMRRYLGEAERDAYSRHNPRAQRLSLLGRIAAKDAVRQWLWARGAGPLWPVEVEITNEESGRPVATVPGEADLSVSIAHTPYVGVAIVSRGEPVGIDAEQIEPRSERFASSAFSPTELETLLGGRPPTSRDEWLTRGWAAKEAVAKAEGTGLGGRPHDFVLAASDHNELTVNGRPVATERIGDFVVAWTPPGTREEGER